MLSATELKKTFQLTVFVPIIFLVVIAVISVYTLNTIFSDNVYSVELLYSKTLIVFFVSFLSVLILHIFSIRPSLLKLQSSAINFREMANKDSLTGLMNRNALIHQFWILQQEMFANESSEKEHIIALVDVDLFKAVNDSYGHSVGDSVLQHISTIMRHNIRTSDSAYRIGGEEFALILPNTNIANAMIVLENMRNTISRTPINFGTIVVKATCTFGVSKIDLTKSLERNMTKADKALYDGKSAGRNTVFANS